MYPLRRKLKDKICPLLEGEIPDAIIDKISSKYQILGDIFLVRLPEEIVSYKYEIGKAILTAYPRIRSVLRYVKGISGELRLPTVELIAGDSNTETIHKENTCLYKLDVTKVMFSRDNRKERGRIPKLVKEGEIVVDMFAGIGYFTIPIAKLANPALVYAIEINPISIKYLRENLKLNKIESKVKVIQGDCRIEAPKLGHVADRVIMGYFPNTIEYLPYALNALKESGGVIHYHDVFYKGDLFEKPLELLKNVAEKNGYLLKSALYKGIVKSYAPKRYHIVVDGYYVRRKRLS